MSLSHYLNVMTQAINRGDYYAIKSLESNLSSELFNEVWRNLSPSLRSRYTEITNRNQATEGALQNIRGTLRDQALQNERRLQEMNENLRKELSNQSSQYTERLNEVQKTLQGELRNQQNQIIDLRQIQQAQKDEYTRLHNQTVELINEERKQRIQSINKLQSQIDLINATEKQRADMAREALEAVKTLSKEIGKMPHEKFAPGKLDKINRDIESVGSATGLMSQAAWLQCVQSWQDLWDLRTEIQLKETEFMVKYEQALRMAVTLLEEARANKERVMEFNKVGGQDKQTKEIDIDFWSNGEWSTHVDRLDEYRKKLEDNFNKAQFSIDDLERTLEELSEEGERLGKIIIDAGNNVAASELRFDLAEIGANVLFEQLFKEDSIKATYEGEDQRAGYILQMENENGVKATMVVSDAEDANDPGAFKLSINFENDKSGLSQEDALKRSTEIERRILGEAERNLGAQKLGQAVCSSETDSSFSDIKEVKRRKHSDLQTSKKK